jgi:triphosphoribosyl-dephospho-CoA synthase
MANTLDPLILDLLEWIGPRRPYEEVLQAWRTSCPRLPVWEEANERGLVDHHHEPAGGTFVSVSPLGAEFLARSRPAPPGPSFGSIPAPIPPGAKAALRSGDLSGRRLSSGQCAALACLLEVMAPKPGNVHRGADLPGVAFPQFATSAVIISPIFDRAGEWRVGRLVLEAIRATRDMVGTNTNLGMVLLMAPLASVPPQFSLKQGIAGVLNGLTSDDTSQVYEAIRLARPGGLGESPQADVRGPAPASLVEAMRLAEDRDLVARQYSRGFEEVLGKVVPWLRDAHQSFGLLDAVVQTHVRLMADYPDSLIQRKLGMAAALESSARAAAVLAAGPSGSDEQARALGALDFWLRSEPKRNPGTTADLIAAGLFALLRQGWLRPPFAWNAPSVGQ